MVLQTVTCEHQQDVDWNRIIPDLSEECYKNDIEAIYRDARVETMFDKLTCEIKKMQPEARSTSRCMSAVDAKLLRQKWKSHTALAKRC